MLWPRRLQGNQHTAPVLDWSAPLDLNGFQSKIIRPALEATGLPARRPARTADDGVAAQPTPNVVNLFGSAVALEASFQPDVMGTARIVDGSLIDRVVEDDGHVQGSC